MNDQVYVLFREVADLPQEARERIFAARNVPPELRAEVESLLSFDSKPDHFMTNCIGRAAEAVLQTNGEPPREPSLAGQTVGAYTLVSPIGHGGMGTVWLAQRSDGRFEGLAAVKSTALTSEGGLALTPEFAAPEQVTGGAITTATDVYSAGVLLFMLLGGQRRSGSPAETMRALAEAEFPRLPAVRGDLGTIVAKALKRLPPERYASAAAFAADLRHYLDHEPVTARPDTLGYHTSKFLRRRWRAVTAATAAALAIMMVTGFYTARLAAERNHARLEAEKTTKVSDLLVSLLTAADPFSEIKEPTVRGLLDAGAARVHKELEGQPELQAQMLTVMGRVYERLGANDKGQASLEEALAVERLGPANEAMAQTLNDLGVIRKDKGDFPGATRLLEEALVLRRKMLGNDHKDVAVTASELGRVMRRRGNFERAATLLAEALRIRRTVFGEDHTETATTENDLALVQLDIGQISEAAALLRQSLAVHRKVFGDEHAAVARVMSNLGVVTEDMGDLAGAEALFRESLAIRRKVLDPKHPDIGNALSNLSGPVRKQGRYEEAAELLQEALDIARLTLGAGHPTTATFMTNLARVYLAQGQPAAAEPLVRGAVEIRRRKLPAGNWQIASAESLLGGVLMALGRYAEAEPLLLGAERVLKDIPGGQGQEAKDNGERLAALKSAAARSQHSR